MKPYAGAVNAVLRGFFGLLCRLDVAELDNVPLEGAYILAANHVNFLEAPVVRACLHPRDVVGLTKAESYKNPLFNFLFNVWGGIPIERGVVDRAALQACIDTLAAGRMLAVAPEGTRSGDGRLLPGKPGIASLAVRSGAPILPIAVWGAENFWDNLKRLRRTPFHAQVGRAFRVDTQGEGLSREVRQRIADEIMLRLAELLPETYRGVYPHPEQEVFQYLKDV